MHARWQSIGGVGCGGWFSREVWVFPTLAGASEVACRVERSSGMVLLCAGRLLEELYGCVQDGRALEASGAEGGSRGRSGSSRRLRARARLPVVSREARAWFYYVQDASLRSYTDACKTAEQRRFFGVDGYLGHFSSGAEKTVRWRKDAHYDWARRDFWQETDTCAGAYGPGATGSGWGDADW